MIRKANGRSRYRGVLTLILTICLLAALFPLTSYASAVPEGAVLPDWYSFPACGIQLKNENVSVDRQIYRDIYGPLKGSFIYDMYEGSEHGICYGVTFTTAAVMADSPALSSFVSAGGGDYGSLNELQKGTYCTDLRMPLLSLIKYAYATQASSVVSKNFLATKNNAKGLYAAVSDFVYHGGPPVAVGLLGDYYSHEVLAVGLLGDEDIIINDSNDPTKLYVMDFSGDKWRYQCDSLSWSSRDADFDYCIDAAGVFDFIRSGTDERVLADDYVYDAEEEMNGTADVFCPGAVKSDTDNLLLLMPENFDFAPKNDILSFGLGASSFFDADYLFVYSWTDADNSVAVQNRNSSEKAMAALGNETGIVTYVLPDHMAAVTVNDDAPAVLLKGGNGDNASFAFLSMAGEDDYDFFWIRGAFDGDEIFARLKDGVVYVSGMREMTAVIERSDGEATAAASAGEGDFLITGSFDDGLSLTLLGDADGDGKVTSGDARIVLRCSVKLDEVSRYGFSACDYDLDNEISAADARLILRRSVGLRD